MSLVRTATGTRQDVVTNRQGEFSFPQVDPGPYTLEASLPGFVGYQTSVALQLATQFTQDITLQLAAGRAPPIGGGLIQANTRPDSAGQPVGNDFRSIRRQSSGSYREVVPCGWRCTASGVEHGDRRLSVLPD